MSDDRFKISEDELDALIGQMERTETFLQEITDDVERSVRRLHDVWEGLSARAQQAAQAEWNEGMADMRDALADLRAAARTAHGNYTAAADANTQMWEAL